MEERINSLKNELEISVKNSLHNKEKAISLNQSLDDARKNEVALKCKVSLTRLYAELSNRSSVPVCICGSKFLMNVTGIILLVGKLG